MPRLLPILLAALFAAPALAQPTTAKPPGAPPAPVPQKPAKVTHLGADFAPAVPALREQLKLPPAVGLLVAAVEPGSPAEAAGLKPHDVLEKLDDQLAVNPEQLNALVRSLKAGDTVTLSVIRQAQPRKLTAKLVEKEVPFEATFDTFNVAVPRTALRILGDVPGMAARDVLVFNDATGQQTLNWTDPEHRITLVRQGDVTKRVTIAEAKSGKTVFDGLAETPEQRKAIPPELLKKVEQAEAAAPARPMHIFIDGGMAAPNVMWGGGGGGPLFPARGKVVKWEDKEVVLILRVMGKTPTYLLALSRKDGRTLFDGPTMTDEQRKGIPPEVAEQFEMLRAKPELAKELGGK